ncbi:aminoacyl-tRNA hydrolase [Elizabethkingia argentiflava]|uniref:Peptidyl-tRNA hydrolase n=1 Tax=Elizabethkingia argenteiflava TaxID=2681556 RepID=A0A845PYN2_9FLAO|nr:aminoacyl-tRNA hydrolase [Elizabethkingia argenteiflava]NAW52021.1 aminoacyl-tRNA hydrolase [Elizabethkingia argenteiflava]
MKYLIVGLGNKGEEYKETRHNIGFKVAERIAELIETSFNTTNFGWMAEGKYKGRKVFVLKPDTYVNLSGHAVRYWLQKEKIPIENLLVITDDLALSFGTLRMKAKGSHGGHNGLRHIEDILQTGQYARLRFGISADFKEGEQVDYVIGRWKGEEKEKLPERIERFSQAALSFVFAGINHTMSGFNGK